MFSSFKAGYKKYERYLMPLMLTLGFVSDYIAYRHLDIQEAFLVLTIHFILAGSLIAFIHFYDAGQVTERLRFVRLFAPLVIQLDFGGLLSAAFIFYWFSASLAVSWPFFLMVTILLLSNEFLKHHLAKAIPQLGIYYFTVFAYFSIVLPYLYKSASARLFLLAGAASLVFFYGYTLLLTAFNGALRKKRQSLLWIVFVIYLGMNTLYFANIIPPIPLALKDAGVYHSLQRSGNGYLFSGEPINFWQSFFGSPTVHLAAGERLYVYTAIFAPSALDTRIYHQWEYYNSGTKTWEQRDRLAFTISGGREQGFRGYSTKSMVLPGDWRVLVTTERGQVLGRVNFTVEKSDTVPVLETVTK